MRKSHVLLLAIAVGLGACGRAKTESGENPALVPSQSKAEQPQSSAPGASTGSEGSDQSVQKSPRPGDDNQGKVLNQPSVGEANEQNHSSGEEDKAKSDTESTQLPLAHDYLVPVIFNIRFAYAMAGERSDLAFIKPGTIKPINHVWRQDGKGKYSVPVASATVTSLVCDGGKLVIVGQCVDSTDQGVSHNKCRFQVPTLKLESCSRLESVASEPMADEADLAFKELDQIYKGEDLDAGLWSPVYITLQNSWNFGKIREFIYNEYKTVNVFYRGTMKRR